LKILSSFLLFCAGAFLTACNSQQPGPLTVGKNVLVSGSTPGVYKFEIMMGADPTRAGNLIAWTQTRWSDAGKAGL